MGTPTSEVVSGEAPALAFHVHKNVSRSARSHQRYLEGAVDDIHYTGANFGSQSSGKSTARYAVGLYDPDTGTVRVSEVPCVFSMTQRVANLDGDGSRATRALDADGRASQRKLLAETFGSKRRRLNLKSAEMNKVDAGNVEGQGALFSHLETSTSGMESNASVVAAGAGERLVPPHNLDAETVEEAFPLSKLITDDEWDTLDPTELLAASKSSELLQELRDAPPDSRYPSFVLDAVSRLRAVADKSERRARARILTYIGFMCYFRECPDKNLSVSGVTGFSGCPEQVASRLIRDFSGTRTSATTGAQRRHRATNDKLRTILHIFALALHAEGFSSGVDLLAKDVGITVPKAVTYFKEIGCKIASRRDPESKGMVYTAALAVPLKFPEIRRPQRARK